MYLHNALSYFCSTNGLYIHSNRHMSSCSQIVIEENKIINSFTHHEWWVEISIQMFFSRWNLHFFNIFGQNFDFNFRMSIIIYAKCFIIPPTPNQINIVFKETLVEIFKKWFILNIVGRIVGETRLTIFRCKISKYPFFISLN